MMTLCVFFDNDWLVRLLTDGLENLPYGVSDLPNPTYKTITITTICAHQTTDAFTFEEPCQGTPDSW